MGVSTALRPSSTSSCSIARTGRLCRTVVLTHPARRVRYCCQERPLSPNREDVIESSCPGTVHGIESTGAHRSSFLRIFVSYRGGAVLKFKTTVIKRVLGHSNSFGFRLSSACVSDSFLASGSFSRFTGECVPCCHIMINHCVVHSFGSSETLGIRVFPRPTRMPPCHLDTNSDPWMRSVILSLADIYSSHPLLYVMLDTCNG